MRKFFALIVSLRQIFCTDCLIAAKVRLAREARMGMHCGRAWVPDLAGGGFCDILQCADGRRLIRERTCEPRSRCVRCQAHTLTLSTVESGLLLLLLCPLVVGSCRPEVPYHTCSTMTTTGNDLALSRVLALIEDKELREKLEEVARFYWTSSNITINLLPAIAATLFVVGGIMLLLWLLGFDMGDSHGHSGSGSGYGAAATNKASYTYDDTIAELQAQVGTSASENMNHVSAISGQ